MPAASQPGTAGRTPLVDPVPTRRARRAQAMRPIMWRLHFIGGVLAGPVVIALSLTGILYAWNPQVDLLRFGGVIAAPAGDAAVPLSRQVAAAADANPGWAVFAVTPSEGGTNTIVIMDPPGGEAGFSGPADAVNVYVDPTSGAVAGQIAQADLSDSIFRTFHSSFGIGPEARPLTEVAGSWFLASLLTGLYLWWPGLRKRGAAAFGVRRNLRGRLRSRERHTFIGVAFFVPMLFLGITGLTWTAYAGDRVGMAVAAMSVESQRLDASDVAAAGSGDVANIDAVHRTAVDEGLVEPYQITLPTEPDAAWVVASQDLRFPVERDQLAVDGTTGEVLDRVDYADEHWFNKLRTAGVLFHQAQLFGTSLQVFMTVLAGLIIAMVVYGYRMWWQRRPAGALGAPAPVRDWVRSAPLSVLVAVAVLGWAMPLLAISVALWLVIEAGWRWSATILDRRPLDGDARAVLAKGLLLIGLAVAMLAVPGLGEGEGVELSTVPRALAWAWSQPTALLVLVVGAAGVVASRLGGPTVDLSELDEPRVPVGS